ncbi:MAG TPA: hypothetical protein VMB53_05975 [Gaiellaceae bacterium]|nr:hypothetical protein [Gaiellaceae bacterium]
MESVPRTARSRIRSAALLAACALVVGLEVGFVSRSAAATNGPAPGRLVGTYSATLPNYPALGFYKGRYTLYIKPGNEIAFHIFDAATFPNRASYSGDRLLLAADGQCTASGSYTWVLRGKKLDLEKLRDPCTPRAVLLNRVWTRAS